MNVIGTSAEAADDFVIEKAADGQTLVVTGAWSSWAEAELRTGRIDGLTLNYARGYRERDLEFLGDWPIRRLHILARTITDLSPVYRLSRTLESLIVETSPVASLDVGRLPLLRNLGAEWSQVSESIGSAPGLQELFLRGYTEADLRPLGAHPSLAKLVMKDRPRIESVAGISTLPSLSVLGLYSASRLRDLSDLSGAMLRELQLEACRGIERLDAVSDVSALEFLNVSDCGTVESLGPLAALQNLRTLYLYGTTRVADADLTPLTRLAHLTELRMQSRREYRPAVREVQELLA